MPFITNWMLTKNMARREMQKDGNCLYRAVAEACLGGQDRHAEIREIMCNYICDNGDPYAILNNAANHGSWAGQEHMQMLSNSMKLRIVTFDAEENREWCIRPEGEEEICEVVVVFSQHHFDLAVHATLWNY